MTEPAAVVPSEAEAPLTNVREMREAIVDLLAATELIPENYVPSVREQSQRAPIAHVLVDQRLASTEAIARLVAARHHLPLVELGSSGIDAQASATVALHVLERIVAIPFGFEDGALCVAIADPQNVHGIDELRLASRHQISLHVAARDDIINELERLARTSEAFGARSSSENAFDLEVVEDDVVADDLEADDGISDAPLVRLVNSIIFEAAEDGASDIHFEPQADSLAVRFRIDGVLHEIQRVPKRMAVGVT